MKERGGSSRRSSWYVTSLGRCASFAEESAHGEKAFSSFERKEFPTKKWGITHFSPAQKDSEGIFCF
jgi:hypothetical protein